MTSINDYRTSTKEFQLGVEKEEDMSRGPFTVIMSRVCHRPTQNFLNCTLVERTRNWTINMEVEFSPGGMISTRKFINKNIVTKKFYQRILKPGEEIKAPRNFQLESAVDEWIEAVDDTNYTDDPEDDWMDDGWGANDDDG